MAIKKRFTSDFSEASVNEPVYTLYDSDGNVAGTTNTLPEGTKVGQTIYRDKNGELKATSDSGVILDTETGKITVKAPELALKNSTFRTNLNNALKTVSANFKANKGYKYNIVDEYGNNQEKTIYDIIDDLNKEIVSPDGAYNTDSLAYMIKAAENMEREKAQHKKTNGVELSDEEIMRMDTIAIGPDVKNNTLQLVSNLPEAKWLRDVSTYDETTGYAQYGDIMENAYNKEKTSSEDIIKLWAALENYFAKGDFRDKEEYIRNVATARFLDATQPNMSWIRDVTENVNGLLNGIGGYATELGTAGVVALSKIKEFFGFEGDWEARNAYYDSYGMNNQDLYIVRGGNQYATDMPLEKVDAKIGSVKFDEYGVPTYVEEKIEGSFENPQTEAETIRAIFKENQAVIKKDIEYLHSSQAGWDEVGYQITSLAALISAGNVLSELATVGAGMVVTRATTQTINAAKEVADVATSLYASGTALDYGATAAEVANIVSGIGTIYDIAAATGKASTFLNFIGRAVASAKSTEFIIGVVGESLAEAIVGEPARFIEVLKNNNVDAGTKEYLISTYVANAIGWGVGIGVGKFFIKAGDTTKGRALSANLSRKLFRIQNAVGDAIDRAILTVRGVEGETLEEKVKTLYEKGGKYAKKQANSIAASSILREMRKIIIASDAIKTSGKNEDEIKEALADLEGKINELQKAEVALNSMQRQGSDIVQGWLKDSGSGLKGATENFYKKAAEVADLERKAGDMFKPVKGAVTNLASGKTIRLFSQTTANYIKASEKLDYIAAYIKKYKHARGVTQDVLKKIKDYEDEATALRGMVSVFVKNATPGLKLAADNFIDADRKWWAKFEDLRASLGLTDGDELASMRGSGLWGTNGELYARTSRKEDLSEYVIAHRDGSSNVKTYDNYENYMAGATGDFADPMGEMQIALYDAGNKQAYRSFAKSYDTLTGSLTTKITGEESEFVTKLKKGLLSNYFDSSMKSLSGIVEDVETRGGIEDVLANLKLKNEQYGERVRAKAAMETTAKKLEGSADTVDASNAARFIPYLDAEDTAALWDEFYSVSVRDLMARGPENVPIETKRFVFLQAKELGLSALEPKTIKVNPPTRPRVSTAVNNDSYPGWNIPERPVWALDESSTAYDGKTLRDYYRQEKGKEFRVIEMPPNEYNRIMVEDDFGRALSKSQIEKANTYVEKFKNGERADIPFIEYDKDGNIVGQEGRHRTFAAYKAGIEKAPVVIEYPAGVDLPENLRQYKDVTEDFVLREQGYSAYPTSIAENSLVTAYDAVNKALAGAADSPDLVFENKVKRSILKRNENVLNDTRVQKYLSEQRKLAYDAKLETTLAERTYEYKQICEEFDLTLAALDTASRDVLEGYIDDMLRPGSGSRAAIDELCKYYGIDGDENALRYFALSAYMDNKSKYNKELYNRLREAVGRERKAAPEKENDKIAKVLKKGISSGIEEEYHDAYLVVKEMNPNAVTKDSEKMTKDVERLAKEIEALEDNRYTNEKNIIVMRNTQGKVEYYQADPLLARLMNFQYTPEKLNGLTQAIYNTNYLWSKLFRLGTTAINLKSMISQSLRDPINMFIGGGAYRTTQDCMDEIVDVAGNDIVSWYKTYEPEALGRLQKKAAETGESVQRLAVEREFAIGRAISPSATETNMYDSLSTAKKARFNGTQDIYDDTLGDKTVRALDKIGDTLGYPNKWRETTLRNISYQNGLAKALKRGYSLAQARTFATFVMNEATTNFTRMTNHLVSIKDTVPYFGAAINGTKSFYKLLSMDPVGVVGRLIGGLIIPMTALTTYSLMDEENKEIYKNIPEYQKEDNIIVIIGGQIVSIPIPQEMGAFLALFRQPVEAMYGVSKNTFAQLAWNDILGFSPIELGGFADLDFAKLEQSSPGFLERIGRGISKLWAQLAPAPLKSGLEIVTGIDPYTGKTIDRSRLDYDEDGNPIIKDYQSGQIARALNDMFRSWGIESSAPVIQNILSNIFGQASVDITDFLVSLASAVPNGGIDWSVDAEELRSGEGYNPFYVLEQRVTAPITVESYNLAQSAWKTEVAKLYSMKAEILRSDAWQEYLKAKKNNDDPEKLKNIDKSKKDMVEDYFNTVKNVVNNLQANYGEEFTAAKYATVLSLMNMDEQTLDAGSYGDWLKKEEYKTARAQAIQTMINMGFPSSSSKDILGKFTTNSNGDIVVKTYSPLAILQLDDTSGAAIGTQSNKQHYAVINKLLSDGGAYALREDFYDKREKAYANKDYKEVERLINEYNEKIIKMVGPYIEQYTPESVLRGDTLDYLAEYMFVPEGAMGKGKYWSSSVGVGANKQDAFRPNYVKSIFGYGENRIK